MGAGEFVEKIKKLIAEKKCAAVGQDLFTTETQRKPFLGSRTYGDS